jgi:hypothetical protein
MRIDGELVHQIAQLRRPRSREACPSLNSRVDFRLSITHLLAPSKHLTPGLWNRVQASLAGLIKGF